MKTAVVHLVWVPLGTAPLERFLRSYQERPSGAPHELLIVFNGHRSDDELGPFRAALARIEHRAIAIPRPGLDINSYRQVVQNCSYEAYCFLNSYSVVLADDWLAKLAQALSSPGVGLVGASGSWESSYTNVLTATALRQMPGLHALYLPRLIAYRTMFSPFPNPHIRTTGFMTTAEVLRQIHWGHIAVKRDAHRFEGGRRCLARQIQHMGLRALVVGRDGVGYDRHDWPRSATFRQRNQENLLIADNRSEAYARANERERARMARLAWGDQALLGTEVWQR